MIKMRIMAWAPFHYCRERKWYEKVWCKLIELKKWIKTRSVYNYCEECPYKKYVSSLDSRSMTEVCERGIWVRETT